MEMKEAQKLRIEWLKNNKSHNHTDSDLVKEFYGFLMSHKKIWLGPFVVVVILIAGLLVLSEGSAIAPFVYTLF